MDRKYSPDMVRFASEEVFPIARLPEPEAFHIVIIVAHRGVSIRGALQIKVDKFLEIGSHNLVGINKNDFLQIHREEYIQEQDFVTPNEALFLGLCTQPRRPLVRDELILEAICLSEVRYEFLQANEDQTRCLGTCARRRRTRKEGDKKFSMNQNLTVCFVFRRTLSIMMPTKRCSSKFSQSR